MESRGAVPALLYRFAGLLGLLAAILPMTAFAFFVAGVGLPRGIDDGVRRPAAEATAIDVALLLSFAVVHSVLARRAVKERLARLWPEPLERSLYSLIAGAQIVLLCLYWAPLPDLVWSVADGVARAAVWGLQGAGWAIVLAALAAIGGDGIAEFFGLAQARAGAEGRPFVPAPLVTRGIYRHLRHPLYAGTILAMWSAPDMSRGRLLLAAVFSAYLLVGYRLEERDLLRERGDAYRAYRSRVPGWLPHSSKGRAPE